MPERPCVLTGMPESIEWVPISFLSFLLLSLLPNAVLCQWCYSVSHTSKCWPRENWGPQEHRAFWSDALNRAPQRLFFSRSLNSLQKLLWNPPPQGEVALRAPRMQFSNCTFPGYWAKLLKGTSLLPFVSPLLLRWPSFQLKKGLHEASKACRCHSRIIWRCWCCCRAARGPWVCLPLHRCQQEAKDWTKVSNSDPCMVETRGQLAGASTL